MAYKDLHTFIKAIEDMGQLRRIRAEVSADLEITEITDRISKAYGPGLLFENVKGSQYPVLINAMGTYERMSIALGVKNLDEAGTQIEEYLGLGNYMSFKKLFRSIPHLFRFINIIPLKSHFRGRCQEVIEHDPNLGTLPVLQCWPGDAGKFITLPLIFTKNIKTKQQNCGMYRMQVLDKTSTGMHWHKHKDGSEIYKGYQERGLKMPVSVVLGCDPAITYASTAPLPGMIDEMMLAGWLRRKNVKMVKSITNDIYIPANAEIVLEGYVDPAEELVLEGPFGDHTGYYSLADYYPRFHVTCITHRKDAVYPAIVVGKPPMEDCYMAKATERVFLPLLRMIIPELKDMNMPLEGVFHNCVIASITARYPGCARKVMNAIWGMGQMMYTKLIVICDGDVDIQDLKEVRDAVLHHVTGRDSLFFSEGPLDALDHSSDRPLFGTRLGVDATRKIPEENPEAGSIRSGGIGSSDMVDFNTDTYHILTVRKERAGQGREALEKYMKEKKDRFVIAVEDTVDTRDLSAVMWKVFNNIDAGRDLVIRGNKIGIDATVKWKEEGLTREWPDDIVMSDEIRQLVTNRWSDYGFEESV